MSFTPISLIPEEINNPEHKQEVLDYIRNLVHQSEAAKMLYLAFIDLWDLEPAAEEVEYVTRSPPVATF